MKATINVKKEVDLKTIHVSAGVRYWEDSAVNGVEDEDGDLMPCIEGDLWNVIIDIETGQILNWEQGKAADVHYKVCDQCSYSVKDDAGETVLAVENDYVPSFLCPKDEGYGDYIIMDIDENGFIKDWNFDASDLEED